MLRVSRLILNRAPRMRTIGVVVGVTLLAEVSSTLALSKPSTQANTVPSVEVPTANTQQPAAIGASTDTSVSSEQSAHSSDTSSSTSTPSVHSSVFVNGEEIAVPPNGEVHQTITSDVGTTHVDISTQSSSSGDAHSSSHMHVQTHTQTTTNTTHTGT